MSEWYTCPKCGATRENLCACSNLKCEDHRTILDYTLETTIRDGKIEQLLKSATEILSRNIMDTREKATREALIKLGWTPPKEK